MTIFTKLSAVSVLALSIAGPAAAQKPAPQGDYYAPGTTIVQQPTAAEIKQDKKGDYYAPDKGN